MRALRSLAWPLLFLTVGIYSLPLSAMGPDLSRIPGDLGDARLNNYVLEHGFRWLAGRDPSFWDAPFFFPAANVIAFSDSHLGTLLLYAGLRTLGLDREGAFQAWVLVLSSLNYIACFLVLRRLSLGTLGAAAGAFVFSFSLPVGRPDAARPTAAALLRSRRILLRVELSAHPESEVACGPFGDARLAVLLHDLHRLLHNLPCWLSWRRTRCSFPKSFVATARRRPSRFARC
jgi:hypothetical protein